MEIYPAEKYEDSLSEAVNISPHGKAVHKDDPYFALALSFNAPIWSDEKSHLKSNLKSRYSQLLNGFRFYPKQDHSPNWYWDWE